MAKRTPKDPPLTIPWDPHLPYNDLPLLPPTIEVETKLVLKQCILARAAVAELKQAAELIPNQGMLVNTLPLLEAQASSEIENIVTTSDRLFQFRDDDESADPATKEALRYSHATLEAFQELSRRPLTVRTAEQVCSIIKGMDMRVRRVPGTALARGAEIVYTPPVGENVLRRLLANWEQFLHGCRDIDPLIRMAIGHYQFEAIHPFTDGNGRTGRILNSLFLIEEQLLTLPILYLSRYIIQHKAEYYQLLREVTSRGSWEAWILYILRGVQETARWTTNKIEAIRKLSQDTATRVRESAPKIFSLELIHLIFELPYCRIQNVVDAKIAERQAASRYLKQLVQLGILDAKTIGRDKVFINSPLLHLLIGDRQTPP
jgi:Fic family protein